MPAKHALLIGIDQYSNFEERYQLRGCVNDAKLMKSILIEHFNFSESDITELHNAAASQQAILDAMEGLADRVGRDDIVVFHFSGHGSQRTSAYSDSGTGKDSTITPADSGYKDPFPNLNIIDKVINAWLARLAGKTRNISLTFDCCHSGTITRDALGARARSVPADSRSLAAMGVDKSQLPPATRATEGQAKASGGWLTLSENYVVMSGCRDDELSYEFESEGGDEPIRNGALTHYLAGALLNARPGTTYRDVFEQARRGVNARFKTQNPQIEGAQDREIFGVQDIEPLRFIPVASVDGDKVTLAGGAAHGLCVHSLWSAYPPGTKQTEDEQALGLIEITRVNSLSAEGLIKEGRGSVAVGARCVETAPAAEQFLLSVDLSQLSGAARDALTERVTASRLLSITNSAGTGDTCAYILTADEKMPAGIALPPGLEISAPTWAVVDRTGELAMPLHEVSKADSIDTLVSNLETMARYRNALSLDNPGSRLKVDFNIFHVDTEGKLHNVNGGDFVFTEGDQLAFEVVNHEDRKVFVSVLDFGLTGKISLFYPPKTSSEMIAPGKTLKIGADERKVQLGMPAGVVGKQGTETIKAMITTDESDFRWLQQEGTRSLESSPSALRRQFEAAYNGPATREMSFVSDASPDEDWKAISRSFELRRRTV